MSEERRLVQVRLPKSLVRMLDHARIDCGLTRVEAIERLLHRGLNAGLLEDAEPRPIEELCGALPDLTGGLGAVEYVRQVRARRPAAPADDAGAGGGE